MKYPYPCARCGFCCLTSVCIAGQHVYGLFEKAVRCPALSFREGIATCKLVEFNLVPIGDGCCIKASAFKNGVEYDFAALTAETKRQIVRITLKGGLKPLLKDEGSDPLECPGEERFRNITNR